MIRPTYLHIYIGIPINNFNEQRPNSIHYFFIFTQQGRQRELSAMTLSSPLAAEFWRHCVLRGRTQRHALPPHQSEEMEI